MGFFGFSRKPMMPRKIENEAQKLSESTMRGIRNALNVVYKNRPLSPANMNKTVGEIYNRVSKKKPGQNMTNVHVRNLGNGSTSSYRVIVKNGTSVYIFKKKNGTYNNL